MYTALWKTHARHAKDPLFIVPPTFFLSGTSFGRKGIPSEQEFPFLSSISQNTEDQAHLGSVTQGIHRYHPTPHTPPVPCGESLLLSGKQCDAIAQVLRHTSKLCLSKTGWAGQKPSGFYKLIFLYPPLTKELIYNNQKLLQLIFSSSVIFIP